MLSQRILRSTCTQTAIHSGRRWPSSYLLSRKRVFTSSVYLRRDEAQARTIQHETEQRASKPKDVAEIKPETVQTEKSTGPAKQESFMAEQTVSNKEQRKADWAIIKDMAQYLWPKNDFGTRFRVGLSVALLVGAKVVIPRPGLLQDVPVDSQIRSSMYKFHSTLKALLIL